jgi:hypothetical protein
MGEWGPLSLLSTKLLGINSSGFGLESREYGRRNPSRWPHDTFQPQKLVLPSPASGDRSVCIVRSRTQATELVYFIHRWKWWKAERRISTSTSACLSVSATDTKYPQLFHLLHCQTPQEENGIVSSNFRSEVTVFRFSQWLLKWAVLPTFRRYTMPKPKS